MTMSRLHYSHRAHAALAGLCTVAVLFGGCVGTGVDTYSEFRSALESGAPCSELFDQRSNFKEPRDVNRIDADLKRIGCESASSERTDR